MNCLRTSVTSPPQVRKVHCQVGISWSNLAATTWAIVRLGSTCDEFVPRHFNCRKPCSIHIVTISMMFGSRCGRVHAIAIVLWCTMLCYVCVVFQCAQLCCVSCWSAALGGRHCCALLCLTVLCSALQYIGIDTNDRKQTQQKRFS